jgi:hypothetical protein
MNLMRFLRSQVLHKFCKSHAIAFAVAEEIVSNFRIICVAALTAPLFIALAGAVAAQTTPAGQSGSTSRYLAGLRPPHEHQKSTHPNASRVANTGAKTSSKTSAKPAKTAGKATAKATAANTERARLATAHSTAHSTAYSTAYSTVHARHRTTDKIAARIDWPRADSVAAVDRREERADAGAMPQTALQFAADDAQLNAQSNAQSNAVAASAPKPSVKAPAPQAAAPNDGHTTAPAVAPAASEPPATTKVVQLERFEAPSPSQSLSAASVSEDNLPNREDHNPRSDSSTAQAVAMLAGAISAALMGWWIFGFGSARGIKVRAYS